ncbi:MAG: VWA domain-containing protein [Gemmatimonadota bacterium]|nr:VWA domain-containing protein [Gemmatimonadota bacterium]
MLSEKHYINVIIVLDCSASMNKIVGPVRKIDIAKKTVKTLIQGIIVDSREAGSMKAGMRVFGSKFFKWKQNCDDTSLEVPLGNIEKTIYLILDRVKKIKAKGQSSLSLSVENLKEDFPDDDEQINYVVVVSDGDESCGGSPCDAVKKMVSASKGVSVSTIGVQTDQAGYDNLNCMAEAGNGLYFDSKDVEKFILSLREWNQIVQENRRTMALKKPDSRTDSTVIAQLDHTANLNEFFIDTLTPLYPQKDDRFPANDTLRPEDKLLILQESGLWIEVFVQEKGIQGWILPKKTGPANMVTVTSDKTPFYSEKNPSSVVISYLDAGETLTVLREEGEWYKVFHQKLNKQGWVIAFNVAK